MKINKIISYSFLLILCSTCCYKHNRSFRTQPSRDKYSIEEFKSKEDILKWKENEYGIYEDTLSFQNDQYDIFSLCVHEGFGFVTQRFFLFSKHKNHLKWNLFLERSTNSKDINVLLEEKNIIYKTSKGYTIMSINLEGIGVR